MSSQNFISLDAFHVLIEKLIQWIAKVKALSSVAASCELTDYHHEIVSNYLNAILYFHDEIETVILELQSQFFNLIKSQNRKELQA